MTPVQDPDTGNIEEVWETFADKVPAEIRPASVREFIAAGIELSKVTTSIKIRHMAGIKPSMRVIHGEQTFNVEGVLPDPESGREWITLPASEVTDG